MVPESHLLPDQGLQQCASLERDFSETLQHLGLVQVGVEQHGTADHQSEARPGMLAYYLAYVITAGVEPQGTADHQPEARPGMLVPKHLAPGRGQPNDQQD